MDKMQLLGLGRALLTKAESAKSFAELLDAPEAQQLVSGLQAKQAAEKTPVFSCCPNCGLRYETTV